MPDSLETEPKTDKEPRVDRIKKAARTVGRVAGKTLVVLIVATPFAKVGIDYLADRFGEETKPVTQKLENFNDSFNSGVNDLDGTVDGVRESVDGLSDTLPTLPTVTTTP